MSYVGQPIRQLEDHRLLTGENSYVHDIDLPMCSTLSWARAPTPLVLTWWLWR